MSPNRRSRLGLTVYCATTLLLGFYFVVAAVQGDFGLFKRIQIQVEANALRATLSELEAQTETLRNKTRRLSDGYIDADLLDEQARTTLGLVRSNEVVLR